MAEIGFAELAAAVHDRWQAAGLDATIAGKLWTQVPPERSVRPYAVLDCIAEAPRTFTNKGKYEGLDFSIELVANDMNVAGPMLGLIKSAIGEGLLSVAAGAAEAVLLKCLPGRVTYIVEATYLRSIIEWQAIVRQNRTN